MKLLWLNLLSSIILISLLNVQGQLLKNDSITRQPLSSETGVANLPILKRGKRYLDFTKGTRMSWRCNVKNNILRVNTLWAYGFGFRVNFPFTDKAERRRPFYKRDVFQSLTDVLDGHGLDGQACILKSYCTAHLSSDTDLSGGMLFKLLKYIFTFSIIVVVGFLVVFFTHTTTNLVRASLLVTEQASSSNNNTNTDEEIAFISFNGNLLNASIPTTATPTTIPTITSSATTTATTKMSTSTSNPNRVLKRGKRYLDFLDTSRMFFRVNGKVNIVPKPIIWANGYGFRANFPIENDKRVRPFRRDTYEAVGDLMDKSGFDGKACILKAFCSAHMDDDIETNKGMLFKLLKYIFTLNEEDKRHFPYLRNENCQQILHSHCPLSFKNISPYTDDV